MVKKYEDASAKEKYDSATKKEAADKDYNPLETLGRFAREKLMPKETKEPVPPTPAPGLGMKKGGKAKCTCMAKGGYVRAADGCATRGKTRGKIV